MSYTVVKESTSDAVGSEIEGSVFDKTIQNYEQLRKSAESNIAQALKYGFGASFKLYISRPQWSSVDDTSGRSIMLASPKSVLTMLRNMAHHQNSRTRCAASGGLHLRDL